MESLHSAGEPPAPAALPKQLPNGVPRRVSPPKEGADFLPLSPLRARASLRVDANGLDEKLCRKGEDLYGRCRPERTPVKVA